MSGQINLDDYVTSYGNFGKCSECEHACMSTALIKGKRFCEECKDDKHSKKAVEFQDSDATFRCPAESCAADKLSFHEILVGSCCDVAMAKTPRNILVLENERVLMNKIYDQIQEKTIASCSKYREAVDELVTAKIALRKARENVTSAEKKHQSAHSDREYYWQLRDKSKKRVLIITKAAFKDYDEPPKKKAKQAEVNEKHQCRVCLHPYDDERQEAIIIPCAHKFCFNCISALPVKKCPNCRADFGDNNVYKTH